MSNEATNEMGHPAWPAGRTCISMFEMGGSPTQEPPCQAFYLPISIIWTSSCTVFAIWNLRGFIYFLIWIYACALQSNIQLRGHATLETSGKGFRIASLPTLFFMVILMNTSWRTPLIHNRFWFCMQGIQFPLDHFMDPFPI